MPKLAVKGTGKKSPLNMRTTAELRKKIEDAAARSGRSLVQEVEYRLERSFWDGTVKAKRLEECARNSLQHRGGKLPTMLRNCLGQILGENSENLDAICSLEEAQLRDVPNLGAKSLAVLKLWLSDQGRELMPVGKGDRTKWTAIRASKPNQPNNSLGGQIPPWDEEAYLGPKEA